MVDRIDSAKRSEIMRQISSSATQPELTVRALVKLTKYRGYRFNLSGSIPRSLLRKADCKSAVFELGLIPRGLLRGCSLYLQFRASRIFAGKAEK